MAGEKWGPWKRAKDDEHFKPFIIQKFEREGTHDIGEFKDMPNFEEKYVVVDEKGGHHEFKGMSEAMRTAERMFKEWKKAQTKPKNAKENEAMDTNEASLADRQKAERGDKAIQRREIQKEITVQEKAKQYLLQNPGAPSSPNYKKTQDKIKKIEANLTDLRRAYDSLALNNEQDTAKLNELKKKVLKSEAPAKVKLAAVKALDARCGAKENATMGLADIDNLRRAAQSEFQKLKSVVRELEHGMSMLEEITKRSNDEVELKQNIKECKALVSAIERAMNV